MPPSIAQVVVGLPVKGAFDYFIPYHLREVARVGSRVYVPFGSKFSVGYVTAVSDKSRFLKLKPLEGVLDNFPTIDEKFLHLTRDMAAYYACSWGEAIEAALPSLLRSKKQIQWTLPPLVLPPQNPQTFFYQGSLQSCAKNVAQKIQAVLAQGRSVLFLIPEVGQLAVAKEFLEKVCALCVVVLDRTLGVKEQLAQWLSVRQGQAKVVVGTRSAVFAMMPALGLIVFIDEENPAYKQEPSPFYHGREIAFWRQKYELCDLLFVTPAPTAELWKMLKDKKVEPVICEEKHLGRLQVIDLANYKYQNMLVSFGLQNHIQETLNKNGKVLLFLNRRGFSTLTKCNQCGHVLVCQRCNTVLSFLYSQKSLVCHRCGLLSQLPKICPNCQGSYLRSLGGGIEKIESELAKIYPQASVAAFDSGSKVFLNEANLMVATAAVLPFLHRAHFALIAVLDFDGEINRIDFRASSRVFSLLVRLRQVAGEKVLVQTRNPSHPAIVCAGRMDAQEFYRGELKIRRELKLPPFRQIVSIILRGTDPKDVLALAQKLHQQLEGIKRKNFELFYPQPDLIPKLRDKFRFTIMLKGPAVKSMMKTIEPVLKTFSRSKGVIVTIDVCP